VVSSPQGWPPSGPGRPERSRQKSAASITIGTPPVPELQVPAGRAGEFQPVGLAVAAGPLGHNVCDDDAVVVGREHRVLTRCSSEVQAVHPRVAREDHIGDVTEGPGFRDTVDDFGAWPASAAHEAGNPAASSRPAGANAMQLGAQLLRPEVLPLVDLERGQRVDGGLAGLLPGLGCAHLAGKLQGS